MADLARVVAATRAAESGRSDDDEDRVVGAVGELVGWTLHWTSRFAQGQVGVAVALARRLPMVLAELRAGGIDLAKAEAFVDALACVDDQTATRIATRLVPKARRWTLTELRASLRYHVDKADPNAARRRYRRRVAERDVWLLAQPDGTASLSAQGLAPHRAAAAFDRIDRIARAARASGDVRTLPQLRADAFCDVLAGIPFQLSPTTDPETAAADAGAEGRPQRAWPLPNWRGEPRFGNRKTTSSDHRPAAPTGPRPAEADPRAGGGAGGDGRLSEQGGGGPEGAGSSMPMPPEPEPEPTDVIDLYEYDRMCLTDEDLAWITIGYEPPGAADDETPDWWQACRPAKPRPPTPDQPTTTAQPTPAASTPTGGPSTLVGGPSIPAGGSPTPAGQPPATTDRPATGERCGPATDQESRSENRNPRPGPQPPVAAARPIPMGEPSTPSGEQPTATQEPSAPPGPESCSENRKPGLDPEQPVRAEARAIPMASRPPH